MTDPIWTKPAAYQLRSEPLWLQRAVGVLRHSVHKELLERPRAQKSPAVLLDELQDVFLDQHSAEIKLAVAEFLAEWLAGHRILDQPKQTHEMQMGILKGLFSDVLTRLPKAKRVQRREDKHQQQAGIL